MRKSLLTMAALVLLSTTAVNGQRGGATTAAENTENSFEKLTAGAEHSAGFVDMYRKDDKLYMAIPANRIGQEFLMNFEIARGIGSSGLYGGTMMNIFEGRLVAFEKHEGKIFLVQRPHRYTATDGTAQAKAVELTYGDSVLETAKIEAESEDKSKILINVYDWFVGDLSNITQMVQSAVSRGPQPGRATLDKSRSHVESAKSFPGNTNIRTRLTFRNGETSGPRTVADGRFIPVSVFYSLAALPETPMQPREADDRLGYFMTVHKDYTTEDLTFYKRYVNKWRLECADAPGADGLCTPKKPIVYYIDHTVPQAYRQAMMEGVNAWKGAFEAAGFRDGIRAEMLPEGVDPGDIRYATLRWNTSDEPGYGAIGPSIVDPRTGEIMDADILFEANMVLGDRQEYRQLVEPRMAIEEIYNISDEELALMQQGVKTASFFAELGTQQDLVRGALLAQDLIGPGDPVPPEYLLESVRWVTMHEVGHTLGLRHNFRSSVDTKVKDLFNRDFTAQNGVFSSVMEYPSVNVAATGTQDGYYYNPSIGSYDRWVISYGYTPDPAKAKEIARESAKPGHAYGTDEDSRGAGAVDPLVNTYDLSDDPLVWGRSRADLIKGMIPRLPQLALDDDMAYHELTDLFQSLYFQYARALAPTVKYIGGQYQNRDHVGDPNGRMPFVAIPKAKQQEALQMIVDYAFDADAVELPQEIYQKFGANRWNHWGLTNTYGGRIDYPLHQTMVGVQVSLMNQLLNPTRLERIRDTEMKFGPTNTVTIPEMMGSLTEAVWEEVWASPGNNIPGTRRDLQRAYLDAMIQIVTNAPASMPADARSVARMTLQDLHMRIDGRLKPPSFSFDDYSKAHLTEAKARIAKALDAEMNQGN